MERLIDTEEFSVLAPAGFYIAVRVGFAFPVAEYNFLPESWIREYTVSGLMVHDPAMSWAYRNAGAVRWSSLVDTDNQGVFVLAAGHGLAYGAVVSCTNDGEPSQRSFGFFCRSDRDYLDDELSVLVRLLRSGHESYARPKNLTAAELETLGLVKNGLLMKEIAAMLGISESAIKQRLKNARVKLNAKTGSQAAAKATMLGMI